MAAPTASTRPPPRRTPGALLWSAWAALFAADVVLIAQTGLSVGRLANVCALAFAAALLALAIREIRRESAVTDVFFPVILLNPLFALSPAGFDRTLMGAALLGLLAAAIVGMRRESMPRYVAAGAVMLALPLVSVTFLLMIPALILWLGFVGFLMARDHDRHVRPRGFVVMGLAEVGLILFGLACLLEPPTPTPAPADLFATIVSFADFPLTVAGIVGLALAWGRNPRGGNPPWMTGLFALLLGFLTLLLNNFQSRGLPPPGADQTLVLLCVLYTIFGLGAPRGLRWLVTIALLAAGVAYLALRPYGPDLLH